MSITRSPSGTPSSTPRLSGRMRWPNRSAATCSRPDCRRSSSASAAEMIRLRCSTIIEAPIDRVWTVLRDFNSHDRWHPAVERSEIEMDEPSAKVGCVRKFVLRDGSVLREQLLSLSDRDRNFRYFLVEAPLPLRNYVAEIRLRPVTADGATY